MLENRHYFVHFFAEVDHLFSTKFVASYHVIILSWPRSLVKSTTSDVAEQFADAHLLVSTGHQWQLYSVCQHAVYLQYKTQLSKQCKRSAST